MSCGKKSFKLLCQYYQLLSEHLANGRLPWVSRQSAYDKDVELQGEGAVHRSPGIYLTTKENSGKARLGGRLMKAVRPVIASNDIGRIAQHVRKERRKGWARMKTFNFVYHRHHSACTRFKVNSQSLQPTAPVRQILGIPFRDLIIH